MVENGEGVVAMRNEEKVGRPDRAGKRLIATHVEDEEYWSIKEIAAKHRMKMRDFVHGGLRLMRDHLEKRTDRDDEVS
jgi:hypothetical protein